MALSLTVEETNFLRLVALTIGVAPRAVRCYFDGVVHPNNLQTTLLNQQKTIDNLRYRKKVLTSVQYNTLFHSGSAVTSKNFDITLMICLLRNISGIAPPVTGYDTLPSPTDISKGADLARIKHYRNEIAHSTDSKMLTQEFDDAWNDVSTAIGRLGGIVFQQECFSLKSSNLDGECYKDILLNIRHSQDEVSHTMANMVEALTKKTTDMENILQDTVPQNIRALYNNEISKWKQEDSKFVSTNQSKQILNYFDTEVFLTITGNSGVGKSFTTKHVALHMLSKGYDVLPVRKPFDILKFVSQNAKIVFVFEDVCGKTHLLHNEMEDWERYSDEIADCILGKDVKILCNCRLQIFQSKEFESLQLLRKCQINLLTSEFTLSEKRLIASKYVSEEVLKELSDECIQAYDCFPLLCRMSKTWEASKALTFLLNPLSVFENELEQMKSREKLNFCALLLVTIFNNNFDNGLLTDDIDINDRKKLDDILEECGETRGTSRILIKDHLDTLLGVYLMFEENAYRFANERLFEMTFTFMAKIFLKFMIKHCVVSMLCDKFGLECLNEGRQHYHFFVPSHFENYFFERLLKEADTYNFLDIFDCKQMTDTKYRAQFLAFCKTFDSEEINRIMKLSYFGINLLHLTSKRGYIDFASFCLGKGVDINKYDDIGMTPLHTACKYENVNLVIFLLKSGVSVNSYKSRGFTALFGACMSGKIHVVKHLLENQADPDLCSGRRLIPLLLVSEKGYFEIAKLLIQFGADINQQDNMGFTALHHACIKGHDKIVELLLENGANVDKSSNDGETPLHFACAFSSNNVIQLLVAKRANLLALSRKSGLSPLRLLYRDQRDSLIILLQTATLNDDINPIFLYALEENNQDLLEIIMEIDLEINSYLKSGKSALHIACQNGDLEIANVLIENNANVNICTKQGETVMQLSCLSENCDLVKLLITKGANIVDYKQSTVLPFPLHIGCLLNNYEMCSIFLQKDICIDVNASEELTLHAAYSIRSPEYINSLLTKVGQWHYTCVTPLEIACFKQNLDIMELLLNSGAEPNSCFGTESFPLSVACIFKNENMVEVLLNNHSNVNTATCIDDICLTIFQCEEAVDIIEIIAYKRFNNPNTPEFPISALHIASICNSENIVKMLLDSKARINLKCSVNPVMLQILANNCQSTYRPEIAFNKYFDCSIIHDILPLHIACLMGNDNIVEMLLRSIANLPNYIDSPILINTEQVICIHGLLLDFDLVSGEEQTFMLSPIQIACFSAHWTILKTLLKHGASIFESCRISNTILAGFSKNMKELQNSEIDGTVFITSVEMFLFETFVKSCIIGDIQTIRDLLVIIQDTSIIHQNKAPIHYACESNQAEVVELLVSNNASVNCRAVDFDTPIHIATRNECTHILELLIKNGGDPLLTNRDGENALHIACKTNNMACLHLLLQSDESVFVGGLIQEYMDIKSSSGMTPLSIAYDNRHKEMLKILILKGADIDKRYGPQKETLVFKACKDREKDILLILLENKARTNVFNIDYKTPLYISCCLGYDEITCLLLEKNSNVNLTSYEGYSPLYFSCIHDNIAEAEMLLKKDANPNVINETGESLLIMSCKKNHAEILDLLLKYNADVNYCHYAGETALYFAFEIGNIDIMRNLLNYNAHWNVCSHERDFFLHRACVRGQYDLVNIILEYNTEIDICALYKGWFLSAEMSSADCMHLLFEFGLNVNEKRSDDGHTALHIACSAGNNDVVTYLLRCENINLESQTLFNMLTPLHMAIKNGDDKIVRLLIENNANVNSLTASGENALLLACSYSHENVLSVLFELKTFDISQQFEEIKYYILNKFYKPMRSVLKNMFCHLQASDAVNSVDSVLHFACRMEDMELLDKLVTAETNIDSTNEYGETPLLIAVSKQNVNIIHKLLDAHASINLSRTVYGQGVQNLFGKTSIERMENVVPVHLACLWNNEEIVSVLLNRNADCTLRFKIYHYSSKHELQCEELSPVYISVLSNNNPMLTMLLNNSLHPMCFREVSIFCNTLISKNHVTFEDNTEYQIKLNLTPFHVALILGFTEQVNTFLNYGLADVGGKFIVTSSVLSAVSGNHLSFIEVVKKYNTQGDDCKTEVTPLIYATLVGNCELINILVENHAVVTDTANISLLDIISINSEITSLILNRQATFPLVSRCRVNASCVALLKNNKEILTTSLFKCLGLTDSIDITIIHFICFRGNSDHLKMIMEGKIDAVKIFTMPIVHLICSATNMMENIEDDDDDNDLWTYLPLRNRNLYVLNISYFEVCCLISEPYFLESLLRHPCLMQTCVTVTPLLLSILVMNDLPLPSLMMVNMFEQISLKSMCSINFIVWLWYYHEHPDEKGDHMPDFVVTDMSNVRVIDDRDIVIYAVFSDLYKTDYTLLSLFSFCKPFNISIALHACLNEEWNTVLQIFNSTSVLSNFIHLEIGDFFCFRNIDIKSSHSSISSKGVMLSALELEYLTRGSISDTFFAMTEAKEKRVFITSATAAFLHNNETNLHCLMYGNDDMNISYNIPYLHLLCFLDEKEVSLITNGTFLHYSLSADIRTLHVACLKDTDSRVLRSLTMKCCVKSFARLSSLHIILLTGKTQYVKEYAINENFHKLGQMAAVHILCFRQHYAGLKVLSSIQCDFNSIATNITFLHLKFLTNEHLCGEKNEKVFGTISELTPLHIASLMEAVAVIQSLLRKTNKTDIICSLFPLHIKFRCNEHFAQLITSDSSFKLTAFHIACLLGNAEIAELFISRRTNLYIPAILTIELKQSEEKVISTHSELSALHLACLSKSVALTRMISSQVKTINEICQLSVWHIYFFVNLTSHVDKLYLSTDYRDSICMLSPIHVACLCADEFILKSLLKRGAESMEVANLAVSYAIIYEDKETIVEFFSSYNYNVNKYPLHMCAENGNIEVCKVLLEHGADTNVATGFASLQPWHLALFHGHNEILSLLLEKPTQIDKNKFFVVFFMYLFIKKYNRKSAAVVKFNRLVVLSLYRQCSPILKDLVFMKRKISYEDSHATSINQNQYIINSEEDSTDQEDTSSTESTDDSLEQGYEYSTNSENDSVEQEDKSLSKSTDDSVEQEQEYNTKFTDDSLNQEHEHATKSTDNSRDQEHEYATKSTDNSLDQEHGYATKSTDDSSAEEHEYDTKSTDDSLNQEHQYNKKSTDDSLNQDNKNTTKSTDSSLNQEHEFPMNSTDDSLDQEHEYATKSRDDSLDQEHEHASKSKDNSLNQEHEYDTKSTDDLLNQEHDATKSTDNSLNQENEYATKSTDNSLNQEHEYDKKSTDDLLNQEHEYDKESTNYSLIQEHEHATKSVDDSLDQEHKHAKKSISNVLDQEQEYKTKSTDDSLNQEHEYAKKSTDMSLDYKHENATTSIDKTLEQEHEYATKSTDKSMNQKHEHATKSTDNSRDQEHEYATKSTDNSLDQEHGYATKSTDKSLNQEHEYNTKSTDNSLNQDNEKTTKSTDDSLDQVNEYDTKSTDDSLNQEYEYDTKSTDDSLIQVHEHATKSTDDLLDLEHEYSTTSVDNSLNQEHEHATKSTDKSRDQEHEYTTKSTDNSLDQEHGYATKSTDDSLNQEHVYDTKSTDDSLNQEHEYNMKSTDNSLNQDNENTTKSTDSSLNHEHEFPMNSTDDSLIQEHEYATKSRDDSLDQEHEHASKSKDNSLNQEHEYDTKTTDDLLNQEHEYVTKSTDNSLNQENEYATKSTDDSLDQNHEYDTKSTHDSLNQEYEYDKKSTDDSLIQVHEHPTKSTDELLNLEHEYSTTSVDNSLNQEHEHATKSADKSLNQEHEHATKSTYNSRDQEHEYDTKSTNDSLDQEHVYDTKSTDDSLNQEHEYITKSTDNSLNQDNENTTKSTDNSLNQGHEFPMNSTDDSLIQEHEFATKSRDDSLDQEHEHASKSKDNSLNQEHEYDTKSTDDLLNQEHKYATKSTNNSLNQENEYATKSTDDSLDQDHEYDTKSTDDSLNQEHEYDTKSTDDSLIQEHEHATKSTDDLLDLEHEYSTTLLTL